jgi:hypothetical protein
MQDQAPEWWAPYGDRFPGWHAFRGANLMYYARLSKSSPPVLVRGESPEDLRDAIVSVIVRRAPR